MIWFLAAATSVAVVPAGLRWLRVAQREHYLAGEVSKAQQRWSRSRAMNRTLEVVAWLGLIGSFVDPMWGFLVPLAQLGPIGLPVRGVTSPLAWTERMRRLAVVSGIPVTSGVVVGAWLDLAVVVVLPLAFLAQVVDLALWLTARYEWKRGDRWVDRAAAKLEAVGAQVVAITGSYGKTTTKNYVAHLLSGSKRVMASPASFNNRMGLARAINENLLPGTEVFVAEMGTYGPGEIAELCRWIPPRVSGMISIGPVHLERFGSLDAIARAKAEILDGAAIGVICIDYPELARIAAERRSAMRIIEVSSGDGIVVEGRLVVEVPEGVFGANLAVALGICVALGVDMSEVMPRVGDLPRTEHRQSVVQGAGGFTIIDDTFNANPEGARAALATLTRIGDGGRTAVITPGMVELGPLQEEENRRFAEEAARQVDHFVIVGRTNRKALQRGSAQGKASVTVVDSRQDAVEWARTHLGPGDAVLYENDLPDHYP